MSIIEATMSIDFEGIGFLEYFSGLDDPRQEGKVLWFLDVLSGTPPVCPRRTAL